MGPPPAVWPKPTECEKRTIRRENAIARCCIVRQLLVQHPQVTPQWLKSNHMNSEYDLHADLTRPGPPELVKGALSTQPARQHSRGHVAASRKDGRIGKVRMVENIEELES